MREGLLKRDFTSRELITEHLERIEATNPRLNSFITVTADAALKQADAADRILESRGEDSPALTGIPVAIKDMIVTRGVETTAASKILKGFIPPYDATAVAKLKECGSIMVGKTNLDEFAMGSSNETSSYGTVKNPWDIERVPGGSSGGSAAAVCAGQAPISLGTDTGGSIRQPAAFCGVVGMKPTYGRVSRYGAIAFASSLDQIGPFTRTVEDMALSLSAISGPDERDSTSMKVEVPDFLAELRKTKGRGLRGMRIGVPKEYFPEGIDPEVEQGVRAGLKELENLGAELVEISLPHSEYALPVYYIVAPAEASSNLARYDGVRFGYRYEGARSTQELYEKTRAHGFGEEVKRRILVGTYVLSAGYYDAYYLKAQQVRTLIINDFKSAFANKCDVIAAPVTPTAAFKFGENSASPLQMYLADIFTIPANLAGIPGISVPCALDSNSLPIGLQLLGKPFDESTLLQVAYALEQKVGFDTRKMTKS